MGLADTGRLNSVICLDSWKGNSKMRPIFASIKNNGVKVSSDEIYEMLAESRSNRDREGTEAIMRQCNQAINDILTGGEVDVADVKVVEEANF